LAQKESIVYEYEDLKKLSLDRTYIVLGDDEQVKMQTFSNPHINDKQ